MNYLACFASSLILLGISYSTQANFVSVQPNFSQNNLKNSSPIVQRPAKASPTKTVFPITGWDVWQAQVSPPTNIRVDSDTAHERITINTTLTLKTLPDNRRTAGYVIESNEPIRGWGGRRLILTIGGTTNLHPQTKNRDSQFDHQKLFRLEVNGNALRPLETSRRAVIDPNFVRAVNGQVTFQLPPQVTKMNFVFYNANLKNVTISGRLSSN